jgi:hypothetical protein
MKKIQKVRIGTNLVPVVKGKSAAFFSAGHWGPQEKGLYYFWTAVVLHNGQATSSITGRALSHLDAGARFRMIGKETKIAATAADRREYKKFWKTLQTVLYVRPASVMEVSRWISTHESDAKHIKTLKFT